MDILPFKMGTGMLIKFSFQPQTVNVISDKCHFFPPSSYISSDLSMLLIDHGAGQPPAWCDPGFASARQLWWTEQKRGPWT